MKIEPTLALRPLPQLRMVPKLMAVNAILVLPLQALEARIEAELDSNPALERETTLCPRCGTELAGVLCGSCGYLLGEPLMEDPVAGSPRTEAEEDFDPLASLPAELSLHEHLLLQLQAQRLQGKRREIGEFLVGSVDQRGYLQADLGEAASRFRLSLRVAEEVLALVQSFEPPGVAARTVEECLLLQLRVLDPTPHNRLAQRLIAEGLLLRAGPGAVRQAGPAAGDLAPGGPGGPPVHPQEPVPVPRGPLRGGAVRGRAAEAAGGPPAGRGHRPHPAGLRGGGHGLADHGPAGERGVPGPVPAGP
jgi:ribosomal protein S27AE